MKERKGGGATIADHPGDLMGMGRMTSRRGREEIVRQVAPSK